MQRPQASHAKFVEPNLVPVFYHLLGIPEPESKRQNKEDYNNSCAPDFETIS
jgi:hypothetical protein